MRLTPQEIEESTSTERLSLLLNILGDRHGAFGSFREKPDSPILRLRRGAVTAPAIAEMLGKYGIQATHGSINNHDYPDYTDLPLCQTVDIDTSQPNLQKNILSALQRAIKDQKDPLQRKLIELAMQGRETRPIGHTGHDVMNLSEIITYGDRKTVAEIAGAVMGAIFQAVVQGHDRSTAEAALTAAKSERRR